jgi:hypothetical protein
VPYVTAGRPPSLLRRIWPWLVGIALLALVVASVPFDAFRGALGRGPHLWLALVDLGILVAILSTESIATAVSLRAANLPRPFGDIVAVRGVTYVIIVVNYALGQGSFGYYLHRSGASAARAFGVTLFLLGLNGAALLVFGAIAWLAHGGIRHDAIEWTLLVGNAGFIAYLVVIAIAPPWLARREWLAPLFDAGLRGHAWGMLGRAPHVIVIVATQWLAMWVWGIEVPFLDAIVIMPAVIVAASLPISPGGLGTTQAAMVYFFAAYAAGATDDERAANVLAFSIVHFVYTMLASAIVGAVCIPRARRAGVGWRNDA